jgi:hypothetical protein
VSAAETASFLAATWVSSPPLYHPLPSSSSSSGAAKILAPFMNLQQQQQQLQQQQQQQQLLLRRDRFVASPGAEELAELFDAHEGPPQVVQDGWLVVCHVYLFVSVCELESL